MPGGDSGFPGPCYLLSLQTLIAVMKESPTIVSLHARLPPVPVLAHEVCIAEVIVGQGILHACRIVTDGGRLLLQHKAASAVLEPLGELEWRLQPTAPRTVSRFHVPSPLPPASPDARRWSFSSSPTGMPGEPEKSGVTEEATGAGRPCRRVPTLTPDQMQTLSHAQRRVFALIDGRKTTEQIARVLSKSPQEVQQILDDLHTMHLITLSHK